MLKKRERERIEAGTGRLAAWGGGAEKDRGICRL